jgi:Tyrosine phosphatase family
MLAMLLQSMIGMSDTMIVNDYHISETLLMNKPSLLCDSSAAASVVSTSLPSKRTENDRNEDLREVGNNKTNDFAPTSGKKLSGRLDKRLFVGAPKQVMIDTLLYVRRKYGSICPGYLNHIGFHETWQQRFRHAVSVATNKGKLGTNNSTTILSTPENPIDYISVNQLDGSNVTLTSKY